MLEFARLAQRGQRRPSLLSLLGRTRQRREAENGDLGLESHRLQTLADRFDLQTAIADIPRGSDELEVVDDQEAEGGVSPHAVTRSVISANETASSLSHTGSTERRVSVPINVARSVSLSLAERNVAAGIFDS